jgi:hypothetical protein
MVNRRIISPKIPTGSGGDENAMAGFITIVAHMETGMRSCVSGRCSTCLACPHHNVEDVAVFYICALEISIKGLRVRRGYGLFVLSTRSPKVSS